MRTKISCCFFFLCISFTAYSAECTVDSILNILNNKTVNETQSKLCSYFFTTLYTQKELTSDLCKNLIDPCTNGLDENSRNYAFYLDEFRLATQIKSIDEQYNDEVADIEFNNAVKLNFTADEQKQIGLCPEVSSTRLEKCSLFEGIPQSVLTDAHHFIFSNRANQNGIDYISLITERQDNESRLEAMTQDQQMRKFAISEHIGQIDKKIEEVTKQIQLGRFENGTMPILYSKKDEMLNALIKTIKENDYKNDFLSIFKFHPGNDVPLTGDHTYQKDTIIDAWWKRFNMQDNEAKKAALEKLIKETHFTQKNFEKEAAQLIKKVRLQMASDISKEICSEKSLKAHREINKRGGLCKVVEQKTKPLENATIDDYWKMYPFEQERLKAAGQDDLKRNFNSHMAMWSCSQIAPSQANSAAATKVTEKDWQKIGESFNKQAKQNEIHTNQVMTEKIGRRTNIRNLSDIMEEKAHKKEIIVPDIEVKNNQNTVASKVVSANQTENVTGNFKNNFTPADNFISNKPLLPAVQPEQEIAINAEQKKQLSIPEEEEYDEAPIEKQKSAPLVNDNSEKINSMRRELDQLKNSPPSSTYESNKKELIAERVSQRESSRPGTAQSAITSPISRKSVNEEVRTISPGSSLNTSASIENERTSSAVPAKNTKTSEASSLMLFNKSYDETFDIGQLISNPKSSDLIALAEKTEGRPFLIKEKEEIFQIVPSLDTDGKILLKNGEMVFKKIKMNHRQKKELSKKLEILREAKEISKVPVRKLELDSLLKKTSR